MKKIGLLPLFLLVIYSGNSLHAQLPYLPILRDSIYSDVLKEKRALEIVLPAGYNPAAKEKYEVIYVTDGEWHTKIVSDIRQFLEIQFLPPSIIVSMPNTYINKVNYRDRDLVPTHMDVVPLSGGADNYIAFLEKELIPYINKKYAVNEVRTYFGGSFGGLFGMYVLLKAPQLFQSYLLADPAFQWDHRYLHKLAGEQLAARKDLHASLLITGREGKPYQYMGVASMDSVLRAKAPAGLRWKTLVYNDETHNSMIFRTVYDGLKFIYAGYSKEDLVFHPMNGILLKDKPFKLYYSNDQLKDIRYTTDGTEPTSASAKIDSGIIMLSGPARLTLKSFCNLEKYNKAATGNFKQGESLPAHPQPRNVKPGGLKYTYYEGTWDKLPDFKKLKPVQSGLADKNFGIHKLPRQKNFACLLEGQLEIRTDGYYIFGLDSDGGSKLYVGGQLLIDNDGIHSSGKFQSYVLPLQKGFYPLRIEYFQKEGNPALELVYVTPDNEDADAAAIPLELEYSGR